MDEKAIEQFKVGVSCPKCFQETEKTLGWLSDNHNVNIVCNHCGSTNQIDKQFVRTTIEQLKDVPTGGPADPFRQQS